MDNIRVMIVDDEQLVRKGLMKTIDWDRFGMTVVADAANGEMGWNQFLEHHPDLVITDIVMPQLGGLKLAQRIKERSPETKILLLSCHSDFMYAQEAIKYGISGYVLKTTFDDEEMEGYLSRIRAEILAERSVRKQPEMLKDPVHRLSATLCSWLQTGHGRTVLAECLHMLAVDRKWLPNRSQMALITRGTADAEHEIGDELTESLHGALGKDGFLFVSGLEGTAFLFYPQGQESAFEIALVQLKLKHPQINWIRGKPIHTINDWLNAVEGLYLLWKFKQNYRVQNRQNAEAVFQAIQYIDANLHTPLHVSDIADNIGLSRSHFSTVFKKVTGENVIHYIFNKRLERARQLLAANDWKVNEIAEKIGIPDHKYFSKWFKKRTGQTPSEYRNQTKG